MIYHHSRNVVAIGNNTFLGQLIAVSVYKQRMRFEKILMGITPSDLHIPLSAHCAQVVPHLTSDQKSIFSARSYSSFYLWALEYKRSEIPARYEGSDYVLAQDSDCVLV